MRNIISLITVLLLVCSCGIYKFNSTAIAPDVKSITINTIENKAMRVNPALSNTITEALTEKYRRFTRLYIQRDGGDLVVEGIITSYETTSIAVTSQEVASQNRLTITVRITFTNKKYPKESFETSFVDFYDYPSTTTFDAVESGAVQVIVEKLVDKIFNETVAKW